MALLRAVGHVLKKADGAQSPAARGIIDNAWKELKMSNPAIFWNFVEQERNNILKSYEFGPALKITIRPSTAHLNMSTADIYSSSSEPTTFHAFMRSGSFEGEDPLSLCREAIKFWREYLDKIDRLAASHMT